MELVEQQAGPVCSVALQGDLDIYAAAEVRARLATLIDQHPVVELQLADVGEIDTAGVQILLAAKQQASSRDHSLRLTAHSATVIEALELCNLLAYFGDPVVEFDRPARTQESA